MNRLFLKLIIVLSFFFSDKFTAQSSSNKPCAGVVYNQFDFWIGDWKVYDTKGNLIGKNSILKIQENCALQENWVSNTGTNKGTSYNFYNKVDNTWNQVWIDNTGFSLILKGGLVNGKMVLKSKLIESKKGNYYNKITWSKNKDNSVTQIWEYVNENGKVLSEVFKGIYKK
ncbi:hypothetical protein JL193_06080 [Polaribacter batillariae]|uniref:Ricin B lectin domain-containing protein n=1 Tax=Polaribacter batillariae TaxID=2808900 RepID=A0ABX7SYM6_9FLAO|nr:hypothetical protein [Polaribacter batillariae]QTD38824.1 hypothetical protein JL193_06080 [Polaribacter batillariae]